MLLYLHIFPHLTAIASKVVWHLAYLDLSAPGFDSVLLRTFNKFIDVSMVLAVHFHAFRPVSKSVKCIEGCTNFLT